MGDAHPATNGDLAREARIFLNKGEEFPKKS
jgi:hypothetical protein